MSARTVQFEKPKEEDFPTKPTAEEGTSAEPEPATPSQDSGEEAAPQETPKAAGLQVEAKEEAKEGASEGGQPSPKSSLKQRIERRVVFCPECRKDIPADEWPNHRDRLRSVPARDHALSVAQKYLLTPLLNFIMWVLVNVFFREVAVVGAENIPKEGPVIFYGNHQNQFMDAIMMRAHSRRPVRFIVAEKSMHRPVVGHFARLMGAVPVVRPQDVPNVTGAGTLVSADGNVVTGSGTSFTKALAQGDVLLWSNAAGDKCSGQVHIVDSDTVVRLTMQVQPDAEPCASTPYKVSKRIDHSEMYADVYATLGRGGCIGIFPEGGSHDRTSLIPLKAGVALFTLGAAERGIIPRIVPCGFTYFYGHKFRSRAHVEFGKPLIAPAEHVDKFAHDKRAATGDLLKILDAALRSVTINVPNWTTLNFLHSFRRLYQPHGLLLDTGDYLRLTRRLALIIHQHDADPKFAEFRTRVENYGDFCNALLVRDSQAATLSTLTEQPRREVLRLLSRRVALLLVLTIVLVPFFVVALPVGLLVHLLSEAHARTALSASTVKVVAADVKASFKVVLGFCLVPLEFALVAAAVTFFSDLRTGLTVYCSLPVVMYVSLIIMREWVLEMRAALPLLMSILSKHKQFLKLHDRRARLVEEAQAIVRLFDPPLEEELAKYADTAATGPQLRKQASLFSLRHQNRVGKRKVL